MLTWSPRTGRFGQQPVEAALSREQPACPILSLLLSLLQFNAIFSLHFDRGHKKKWNISHNQSETFKFSFNKVVHWKQCWRNIKFPRNLCKWKKNVKYTAPPKCFNHDRFRVGCWTVLLCFAETQRPATCCSENVSHASTKLSKV